MILRWVTSFLLKCILIHLSYSVRYDAVKQQTGRELIRYCHWHSNPIKGWVMEDYFHFVQILDLTIKEKVKQLDPKICLFDLFAKRMSNSTWQCSV